MTPKEVEDIRRRIGNEVYQSTDLFDVHEYNGKSGIGICMGNANHMMQKVVVFAQNLFVESLVPELRVLYEPDGFGGYQLKKV